MSGSGLFSTTKPQKGHLVPGTGHGIAGEVADLRTDVVSALAPIAALTVEEFTNPALASVNAIKLAIASVASVVSYATTDLDGAVGAAVMNPPRNITVTTAGATPADAPATATITGLDANGAALVETLTVAQTATIAVGVKAFAKVTSIALPAADGVGATLAFGFGALLGLGKKVKSRAGLAFLMKEIAVGAVVTNGVIADATVSPPNGTYAPNLAPDGVRDYAIYYEFDPTI